MMQEIKQGRLGIGAHHKPVMLKDEWLTPPEVIDAVGGPQSFDLDPCAPLTRPWDMAKAHYTITDNGLLKPWFGRVWFNPPYGGPAIVTPWMRRMAEHGVGTALLFARTETDMFFETVWYAAHAVLFLRGRLHFHHGDGSRADNNSGGPSALVAYGEADAKILQACRLPGQFVPLQPQPKTPAAQISFGEL